VRDKELKLSEDVEVSLTQGGAEEGSEEGGAVEGEGEVSWEKLNSANIRFKLGKVTANIRFLDFPHIFVLFITAEEAMRASGGKMKRCRWCESHLKVKA